MLNCFVTKRVVFFNPLPNKIPENGVCTLDKLFYFIVVLQLLCRPSDMRNDSKRRKHRTVFVGV